MFDTFPPTGSTAYARDLVYLAPSDYQIEHRGPTVLALEHIPPAPDPGLFCSSLCIPEAEHISHEGGGCIIEFTSEHDKDRFARAERPEVGPYRLRTQRFSDAKDGISRKYIELEKACERPDLIDVIHIEEVDSDEEWKELYARRIDVVPLTAITNMRNFDNMASVHSFVLPNTSDIVLYFNTTRPPWSNRDARKWIASKIDAHAIADVACFGHPRCVIAALSIVPPKNTPTFTEAITILALNSDSSAVRAARAVAFHLNETRNLEAQVSTLGLKELGTALGSGDYDLAVLPLPLSDSPGGRERLRIFLAQNGHYENPALDRAIQTADPSAIEAILREDVPILRLYANVQFAAIDDHFCPRWKPDSQVSWRWLAYLYPCKAQDSP